MKALLEPLTDKKYYGTTVSIVHTDEDPSDFAGGTIEIWVMGNYKPSPRQIEVIKEHYAIYNYSLPPSHEEINEWCSDGHYETETGLQIAELLVKAVNEANASTRSG